MASIFQTDQINVRSFNGARGKLFSSVGNCTIRIALLCAICQEKKATDIIFLSFSIPYEYTSTKDFISAPLFLTCRFQTARDRGDGELRDCTWKQDYCLGTFFLLACSFLRVVEPGAWRSKKIVPQWVGFLLASFGLSGMCDVTSF